MTVNPSGWRPSTPANAEGESQTVTGNRALMLEEPLIFELDRGETTGVDFEEIPKGESRLGGLERSQPDRASRPQRARSRAPLHPAVAAELCDRPRPVSRWDRAR